MQRKEKADDGWEEQYSALKIELLELLLPCRIDLLPTALNAQKRDDKSSGERAERQINEKAPAPREVVGEGSAHTKRC